jgi:hypothetical protein
LLLHDDESIDDGAAQEQQSKLVAWLLLVVRVAVLWNRCTSTLELDESCIALRRLCNS